MEKSSPEGQLCADHTPLAQISQSPLRCPPLSFGECSHLSPGCASCPESIAINLHADPWPPAGVWGALDNIGSLAPEGVLYDGSSMAHVGVSGALGTVPNA